MDEPALTALNMRLRDDYTQDCAKGVERWNKIIEKTGVNFRLVLPHVAQRDLHALWRALDKIGVATPNVHDQTDRAPSEMLSQLRKH